jgi:hypothetical protein
MMIKMGSSSSKARDETTVLGKKFIGKKFTMTGGG